MFLAQRPVLTSQFKETDFLKDFPKGGFNSAAEPKKLQHD